MMAWTDRRCRYLHRLVAPCARLYTEMVSTDALLNGDATRLLLFNAEEHPVALQLGGDPGDLAKAARLAAGAGFDEVNLNVGCPSERVRKGDRRLFDARTTARGGVRRGDAARLRGRGRRGTTRQFTCSRSAMLKRISLWDAAVDPKLEANRRNWNERTPIHAASDFYDVPSFKAGRITLHDIERREVGDVAGKALLHMQCHFGLDTMSWTRLGADATGVDFSDEAIALARSLRSELGLPTQFVESNVYDLPQVLGEQFDIVYTAMGVLCWLPDLDAWAKVAGRFVKPGGFFYLFDGHPLLNVFRFAAGPGQPSVGDLRVAYPYFHDREGMYFEGGDPSYAGSTPIASGGHEWAHSLAEIVTAVQNAGLTLEFLHEFPANCYQAFPGMKKGADGWWRYPEGQRQLPQTFSLRARKAA